MGFIEGWSTTIALTGPVPVFRLKSMEVNFRPETESQIQELAAKAGREPAELVEDVMAGYLQEAAKTREMLDSRYDDIKSGRVKPIAAKDALAELRRDSLNDPRRARS